MKRVYVDIPLYWRQVSFVIQKQKRKLRVVNCCVKKFNNKTDKIFRAVAKVKKDFEKSVNSETLNLAFKNTWINAKEYKFYMDILRKRKLSEKQTNWKIVINKKML